MHMWMWFGYDLGPFLFNGLDVTKRWQFAITWIVLFIVAVLFEASKVYLARVQRAAQKQLFPFRSDERRNLLCRDHPGSIEPSTSRNASHGQGGRWASARTRMLVNCHQTFVFLVHNVVGYLLMLAVMVYNVELMLAVVLGMMTGYFLFGPKLTRLQMQCFRSPRAVICTPECDDSAETSTPPLGASVSSESDFLICQTRTCVQPSHYFRAGSSQDAPNSCHFGAKCPSKVAKAKTLQKRCHEEPNVEDTQLLGDICCNKESLVEVHEPASSCCREESPDEVREDSPQITCCSAKATPTISQEQII